MTIVYILLFILVLGIVICFHEYGHYLFAKKANILVNEFAFGMGPRLLWKKKGETIWSIRAFPIGGFCAMSGEEVGGSLLKPNDKIKLVFNEEGKVKKIVTKLDLPEYSDIEETIVEKVDLFGKDMSPLYINDFEVLRDALVVIDSKDEMQIAPEERNFFTKTVWQRFFVCLGGPLNNFILGIVAFLLMAFIIGVPDASSNIIGSVNEKGPAYLAGIQKDDKIIKIGEYEINGFSDVHDAIYKTKTRKIAFEIERGNARDTYYIYAQYAIQNLGITSSISDNSDKLIITCEEDAALGGTNKTKAYQDGGLRNGDEIVSIIYNGEETYFSSWDELIAYSDIVLDGGKVSIKYRRNGVEAVSNEYEIYSDSLLLSQGYDVVYKQIGIAAQTKIKFGQCLLNGLASFANAASIIFSTLWLLLTSKEVGINDMGGFITILNQTAQSASGGFTSLLSFVGLLSVNLGIVNLLPIPALDGGRIIFLLIEGITKKKINPKIEAAIINIVFWLLMALIVYILGADLVRLFIQLR